jgi:hypothetical protein
VLRFQDARDKSESTLELSLCGSAPEPVPDRLDRMTERLTQDIVDRRVDDPAEFDRHRRER